MLEDIRNGKSIFLKPVKIPDEPKPSEGCPPVSGGIVDILMGALGGFRHHMTSDNDNSSEDDVYDDDDEDWED
ncbi:hypothetical protein V1264_019975 [Littorina saxatilis]|uniref:Uncharacterized protein n=1 Tax=Littorina saxatilis TaxID=31220 RepID=A0AAN9BAI9_9CAEN